MKRLITIILMLAMCLSMFAACAPENDKEAETTQQDNLVLAKDYLKAMYKEYLVGKDGYKLIRGIKVSSKVAIDGKTYDVEWTTDVTAGNKEDVKIVADEKDTTVVKVEVNTKPAEKLEFTLTGTLKDDAGRTESVSFKFYVEAKAPESEGPKAVEKPEAGVAYKFALRQENLGKMLYFAGKMKGNYFATTETAMNAVDVYIEEVEGVEGGVRFYFMNGDKKTYLDIQEYEKDGKKKAGVKLVEEPVAVFKYSEEAKTFVANVAGEDRYLGTYKDFNTISASAVSYITGNNADKVGVSQFVAGFYSVPVKTTVVDKPVNGTAYKFFLRQENLGKNLYFAGAMKGNFFATTENALNAVDVYIEAVEGVEGGVRFYFMDGETKTYLDIHEYKKGKAGVRLTAEPTAVFTYSEEAKTFVANVAGEDRYLGTYGEFNTISASAVSYITGNNADKVGVSQFVAAFCTVNFNAKTVEKPVKDVAYKFFLRQENIGKNLYFAGAMNGNFFATTENAAAAVDVYLEEVEGGVRFYFMDGETKTYLDIHEYKKGKAGVRLTAEPTAVFTYSEEAKTFVANVAGEDRYLGTYGDFNTISASATSYITGNNADKVGVSQFVACFVVVDII